MIHVFVLGIPADAWDAPPRSFLSMDMANDKEDDDDEAEEAVKRFGGWKLSENEG